MMNTESLPGIKRLIHLARTQSTQLAAKALAESGCAENTVVIADEQTAGYGRLDHKWASAPGGLYFSLLVRPETEPVYFADLSAVVAEVLAGIFRCNFGLQAKVKLPNDVYVFCGKAKKWLKISGVLSEAASVPGEKSEWLIIGIGVNINNEEFPETAVSLKQLIGKETGIMEFAGLFFKEFWPQYFAWECGGRLKSAGETR
ncbi:MAG: biotin--[acetyl-CoA-carboxylase] ligase [Elusimicrobiales bacterium]|nr:biotin--[acetyl-CoA-carboxylase] ligase [Elusimicrobiales bacterium]